MSLGILPRATLSGWGAQRGGHLLTRAGGNYRESVGRDRSANKAGPIHDLSDFHLIDGTAPPVTMTQQRWQNKRDREVERIERLENEMVELHTSWLEKESQNKAASDR